MSKNLPKIVRKAVEELNPDGGLSTRHALTKALVETILKTSEPCVDITVFPQEVAVNRPATTADHEDDITYNLDDDGNPVGGPVVRLPNQTARVIFIHTDAKDYNAGYTLYPKWEARTDTDAA